MTFFKYFVTIFGLLLAGSGAGWAADDSVDTGAAGGTTTPASTTTHKTVHHRHHHTKTATTGTSSTNAAPSGSAVTSTQAAGGETKESETSSARRSGSGSSKSSEDEAGPAAADASNSAKPAATSAVASGTAKPATSHHLRHHHGASTAASTNTTTAPETAATTAEAKPETEGASSTPNATGKSVTQTSTKGRHHRHGKTTAAKVPEPPIVVPDTHPSLAPAPPPAATVTLPTPPPVGEAKTSTSAVPIVQTGLPVARPGTGTTATLPIAPVRVAPPPIFNFAFKDFSAQRRRTRTYPWKSNIVTTVFWIGEGSTPISAATNKQSAWDMEWVHHNGGADDQNDMSGYASSEHASTLNPFYVALPFNDLAYPEKSERWLPEGWYKPTHHGEKPVSACQGRWVEIKSRSGRYCFAQWEDVGPMVTDDAEYVFGPERPSAMQGRGLDVSPAVAKYLGFDSTAITSWRFVDDDDVLPGMWLRYDEQALLFRAMKEEMHGSSTPRIQDLEEPVPDPDDSSQKKSGAARG